MREYGILTRMAKFGHGETSAFKLLLATAKPVLARCPAPFDDAFSTNQQGQSPRSPDLSPSDRLPRAANHPRPSSKIRPHPNSAPKSVNSSHSRDPNTCPTHTHTHGTAPPPTTHWPLLLSPLYNYPFGPSGCKTRWSRKETEAIEWRIFRSPISRGS